MDILEQDIVRTLCYYDLFSHPLTSREIFLFLPQNSISFNELHRHLKHSASTGLVQSTNEYYFLPHRKPGVVVHRCTRERLARRRWYIARVVAHIIKRFPFVRGVFVSGDLAKNATLPRSDIDYVVVTDPKRLWISRFLLILFKKIFLLNSKKYFCLNYFVTTSDFVAEERNYFTATEIAHLKPLYNFPLFLLYLNANRWIKNYFPNFLLFLNGVRHCNSRASRLQKVFELPFRGHWVDRLDFWLMKKMEQVWKRRYPHLTEQELELRFRCRPYESRAFGKELTTTILNAYEANVQRYLQISTTTHD